MKSCFKYWWLLPLLLLGGFGRAWADEDAVPDVSSELWPALIKLVVALAFILIIIYGSVWLLKRFSLGKVVGSSDVISVVDRRFLAPKQALYLIKVGRQHLLVGSSEAGLTRIAEMNSDEFAEKPQPQGNAVTGSKFNRVLRQARETFMPLMRSKETGVEMEAK